MELSAWELAALACKFGFYVGTALCIGAVYHLAFFYDGSRRHLRFLFAYGLVGGVIGFQAVLLAFLVEVGGINGSGVGGMFDWDMAAILLDTAQGEALIWRLAGFTASLLVMAGFLWRARSLRSTPGWQFRRQLAVAGAFTVIIIAGSYRLLGHVSVLATPGQLAQFIHILCFSGWTGSLLPLLWLSRHAQPDNLGLAMRRFGDQAMGLVGLLVIAGIIMLFGLLQSPTELIDSAYGRALLFKLTLVLGLLALAAANRFMLVPRLAVGEASRAEQRLRRSIQSEVAVATLILIATAYLSTVVGPAAHQG